MTRPALLTGKEKRKFPLFSAVMSVLLVLIFALFFFEMWFLGRFTPVNVDGKSMSPTLENGDWLYAESKVAPKRGDIVIVNVSDYENEHGHALFQSGGVRIEFIIKRVIALAGDEIYGENNRIYLKKQGESGFTLLKESYAYYEPMRSPLYFGSERDPIEIKEGEMFVMGDNRLNSQDSTEIGTLYVKDVTGVVPAWSVENKGAITKWENFRDRFRS